MRSLTAVGAVLLIVLLFPVSSPARLPDLEPPQAPGRAPNRLYAIQAPNLFSHNVGPLTLQVTNLGIFGNPFIDDLSAGWRGGEYLFLSGPWLGAIPAGGDTIPRVSTVFPLELRPELDPQWVPRRSFEGAYSGGSHLTGDADDDGDGIIDEDFLDGFDNDLDGMIDEDYLASGSQMLSCVYRDDTPEAIQVPDHMPMGLLVRQRSMQWTASGINEFVGVEYEVINNGEQSLDGFYFALYTDSDVGPKDALGFWSDDLVGWDTFDTTLTSPWEPGSCTDRNVTVNAAFMWDTPDAGGSATGDAPGVFGTLLMGHPVDPTGLRAPTRVGLSSLAWFRGDTPQPQDDPERYAVLSSGQKPTENPLPGVATGSSATPGDYAYVMAAGPFQEFGPGESLVFHTAYVIGDGFASFRANAAMAQLVYQGLYLNVDQNDFTGIDGKERCLFILEPGDEIHWDDPCDTTSTTITYRETPACNQTDARYVDEDCNPCTGVDGRETAVHWVGQVTPPSPRTNLDPLLVPGSEPALEFLVPPGDSGRVVVQWDNGPECLGTTDRSGNDIFEGYRIWKVSEWPGTRGPDFEDWVPVAEYRLHPVQGSGSLSEVLKPMDPYRTTDGGCPLYPIGRYEFVDSSVVNCSTYYYAVTAIGDLPGTGIVNGAPFAPTEHAVVPRDASCGTPVRLLSFVALRDGVEALVRWSVAGDDDAGFHVYRESAGAERARVSETLFSGGSSYEFRDTAPPGGAAGYWLLELGRDGTQAWHGPAPLPAAAAFSFRVSSPAPNPFRAGTRIAYTLPESRPVRASVYDLAGREVRVLWDGVQEPGAHGVTWDGRMESGGRAAAGLYLLRLAAGSEVTSRKVVFMD